MDGEGSRDDWLKRSTPRWFPLVSVALAWGASLATAAMFVVAGRVLDDDLAGARTGPGLAWLVVLALVAAALTIGAPWFSQWAGAQAERRLRAAVADRVFELGPTGTQGRSGQLLGLATSTVERVAQYRVGFLGPILGSVTIPFLVLGVMAVTTDAVIAGWLVLLVLLVPVLIGVFQRAVGSISSSYRQTQLHLTAGFLEAIQSLETLVYARATGRVAADLAARGERHRKGLMRMLAGNQLIILVVDAAFSLTVLVAAALLAASRVGTGELSLGGGVAIVLMSLLVTGPVDVVGQFFYIGMGGRASQRRLADFFAEPVPGPGAAGSSRDDAAGGSIEFDAVTAGWSDGPDVLTGLSFRVDAGERVALVGPSGVGKSTAAALVQAYLAPRAGRVLVDGLDVAHASGRAVRACLSVVEQRTFLFAGSIRDNLLCAAPDASEADLWQALELAGLDAEVQALPLGLDAPVGEHGALLSGGQAQRVAIARAALRDAPILVLDEPTSQVDLAAEASILAALDRLAAGRTVLMIAHRPGAILAADRVVDLGRAEVAA